MEMTTLLVVLLTIISIITMASIIVSILVLIITPGDKLSFGDRRHKYKMLKYLNLK